MSIAPRAASGPGFRAMVHDWEYAVLGRCLTCMLSIGTTLRTPTASGFHFWRRVEGEYAIEWTGGPHATEVLKELEELAADDDATRVLLPGDITETAEFGRGAVRFRVRGVPFQLRPVDTIGVEASQAQVLAGLSWLSPLAEGCRRPGGSS